MSAKEEEPDLSRCPECEGPADNGHDRCLPPNPYLCTRCTEAERLKEGVEEALRIVRSKKWTDRQARVLVGDQLRALSGSGKGGSG